MTPELDDGSVKTSGLATITDPDDIEYTLRGRYIWLDTRQVCRELSSIGSSLTADSLEEAQSEIRNAWRDRARSIILCAEGPTPDEKPGLLIALGKTPDSRLKTRLDRARRAIRDAYDAAQASYDSNHR